MVDEHRFYVAKAKSQRARRSACTTTAEELVDSLRVLGGAELDKIANAGGSIKDVAQELRGDRPPHMGLGVNWASLRVPRGSGVWL